MRAIRSSSIDELGDVVGGVVGAVVPSYNTSACATAELNILLMRLINMNMLNVFTQF